jgi:hypothetical protein
MIAQEHTLLTASFQASYVLSMLADLPPNTFFDFRFLSHSFFCLRPIAHTPVRQYYITVTDHLFEHNFLLEFHLASLGQLVIGFPLCFFLCSF